jgi:hypothetical protein
MIAMYAVLASPIVVCLAFLMLHLVSKRRDTELK